MAAQLPTLDEIRQAFREELAQGLRSIAGGAQGQVLTTEQAAEIAGVSAKTVREWISTRRLPAGYRGQKRTIKREDLDRYLAGEKPEDKIASIDASLSKRSP